MKKIIFKIVFILLFFFGGVFLFSGFKENIRENIKNFVFQKNIFSPAAIVFLPQDFIEENSPVPEIFDEGSDDESLLTVIPKDREEKSEENKLLEIKEILEDLSEKLDLLYQEAEERMKKEKEETELEKEQKDDKDEQEKAKEKDKKEIVFCEKSINFSLKTKRVIFNEIAWMGNKNSANNEWMELKNISEIPVDLKGWQISDKDGQIKIVFQENSILSPGSFYLLERTDDNSVKGITADLIYSGGLNDDSEELYLFDENCALEDEITAISGWPAGDKKEKKSMERGKDLNWHDSCADYLGEILGTPRQENSVCFSEFSFSGGVTDNSPVVEKQIFKILITEVQIKGEEPNFDFIELYNPNTTSIDVSGFQLKKRSSEGGEYSIRVFPEGSAIFPKDYFLWINSEYASFSQVFPDISSSQTLAKDNSIALLDGNKNKIDSLAWGSGSDPYLEGIAFLQNPEENQSLGRKWDIISQEYQDTDNNQDDFEIQIPTPKAPNQKLQLPVNQLPIVQFIYSPASSSPNQDILFDASSSIDPDGIIANYIWDFGDNNSATTVLSTTTYRYAASGDFIVSLTLLDNNNATNSCAQTINISVPDVMPVPELPTLEVVINEIAWMGTEADSNDEWIELYNNTDQEIILQGWKITANDGIPEIILEGIIFPKDYFLLERTDDQAISDIKAGQIYTGVLGNSGEALELRDANNNQVDFIDCSLGWFAGQNEKIGDDWVRMSMERKNPKKSGNDSDNWATNNGLIIFGRDIEDNLILGTPGHKNSVFPM